MKNGIYAALIIVLVTITSHKTAYSQSTTDTNKAEWLIPLADGNEWILKDDQGDIIIYDMELQGKKKWAGYDYEQKTLDTGWIETYIIKISDNIGGKIKASKNFSNMYIAYDSRTETITMGEPGDHSGNIDTMIISPFVALPKEPKPGKQKINNQQKEWEISYIENQKAWKYSAYFHTQRKEEDAMLFVSGTGFVGINIFYKYGPDKLRYEFKLISCRIKNNVAQIRK